MGELAIQAGIPPGVINIITGDGPVAGAALAAHPGIDKACQFALSGDTHAKVAASLM